MSEHERASDRPAPRAALPAGGPAAAPPLPVGAASAPPLSVGAAGAPPLAGAVPSPWVQRFAALPAGATALDLACGNGRHARWLAARGVQVTAVDRDAAAIAALAGLARVQALVADLEHGPWPLPGRRFDAVIVTRYLHRPLFDALAAAVAPGGRLLIETFAVGQARYGRPQRPEFLLAAGELLHVFAGRLHVLAYEDGIEPGPARVQRLAALRLDPDAPAAAAALALGADVESAACSPLV